MHTAEEACRRSPRLLTSSSVAHRVPIMPSPSHSTSTTEPVQGTQDTDDPATTLQERPTHQHHHHHNRLLYFFTEPPVLPSALIPAARAPISSARITQASTMSTRQQPIRLTSAPSPIASRPIAVAAVEDDCCAACCPRAAAENMTSASNVCTDPACPSLMSNRQPERSVNSHASSLSLITPSTPNRSDRSVLLTGSRSPLMSFSNDSGLGQKRKHMETEAMICKWAACSAVFRTLDDLTPHLFKKHLNNRTIDFNCHWGSCSVTVDGSDALLAHLTNHLGQRLLHGCRWAKCRERFETFHDLRDHLSEEHVGTGRSEYTCEWTGCDRQDKVFTQRQKIMRHIQTHTGDKPFQCTVCKKRFSESNIMTQHMRTHTGEKPYKCPEKNCNREFSISGALTIHKRVHSGEKPFSCKYQGCDKKFAESSNLTKHMRVHTGERPFRCSIIPCGKSFSRPDQVSRHLKSHQRRQRLAANSQEPTEETPSSKA